MTRTNVLRIAAVPAILAVGFLAMQALGSTEKEARKRQVEPEARAVEVRGLQFGDLTLRIEGDGVIEPERKLEVLSEAAGRVLYAKNDLKDGTFVREGEVVVRIDRRDVENELYGLRSDFMNAVASVLPELKFGDAEIYRKWFDYFNSLDIDKPVPELPPITHPQEKMKVSGREIIGKYYAVRNREIQLAKHVVRAPFSGFIGSSDVIENAFVSVGQPLFTLADPTNLVVSVPLLVDETRAIDFAARPHATVYAGETRNEVILGQVTRKKTDVDRNSQSLYVYVTVRNPDLNPLFLPGNYVHVAIEGRTLSDVATLPRHLLDDDTYVFTMQDGGRLGREKVEVLGYQGDLAIIAHTVPDDTRIVSTILQKPLVGMRIRSITEPDAPSSIDLAAPESEPEPVSATR